MKYLIKIETYRFIEIEVATEEEAKSQAHSEYRAEYERHAGTAVDVGMSLLTEDGDEIMTRG